MAPLLTLEAISDACLRVPEPVGEIVFLRPVDVRKLLEACTKHDAKDGKGRRVAPFVLALLLTGCRLAELANLRWGEVADDGLHLEASRIKTRRARVVTFAESLTLCRLFAALRPASVADSAPVFRVGRTWEQTVKRLRAHYGAPDFTAHTLRRTCGTILTNAPGIHGGASAWHSAKRLGHSVEQSERDYAGQLPGLPANAKTIEAAVGIEDLAEAIVSQAAPGSA